MHVRCFNCEIPTIRSSSIEKQSVWIVPYRGLNESVEACDHMPAFSYADTMRANSWIAWYQTQTLDKSCALLAVPILVHEGGELLRSFFVRIEGLRKIVFRIWNGIWYKKWFYRDGWVHVYLVRNEIAISIDNIRSNQIEIWIFGWIL